MNENINFKHGLIDMLPMTIASVPFGLMVGALAAQKGLDGWQILMMSALVYAGAAQFMALDMWTAPVAIWAIIGATGLINLRHIMMGAALRNHIYHLPIYIKWPYIYLMSDEAWATGIKKAAKNKLTVSYVMGMLLPFYLAWIFASLIGVAFGNLINDPAKYGFDFVFTTVFISMTMGFWQENRHSMALVVAATSAVLSYHYIGGVLHIFIGGLLGTITAAIMAKSEELN